MSAAAHPIIDPVVERYRKMTLTDYLCAAAWKKQRDRMDLKAREDFVRDEGEAIGYNRAMETLARKLKDMGLTEDKIVEATRFSAEKVARL
ncbi:hypothetical protein FACS1894130_11830 [Spirochaetia bacterium]|nr:hypothetical protein FACS1894130_11830 [Spirochaetia bacterium]